MQAILILSLVSIGVLSGASIAYVIGAASIATFILTDKAQFMAVLPQRLFSQLDVFAFLAMPLFIFASDLVNRGGLASALIDFCMSFLGRLKGGLKGRGRIEAGAFADIVVFDADRIKEAATYDAPVRPAQGIETVFVNGRESWSAFENKGVRAGCIL